MIKSLHQLERTSWSVISSTDPVVLCAADEHYIMPLAVTLHSAATHLREGSQLNVLLMDGGLSESAWQGLKETLVDLPINIHVIRPDVDVVSDLSISHHITHTAYFRLLAARLIPESIEKVIYLDSDVLVQDDLSLLWEQELGDHYCLAVPDIACPFVDARRANSNFKQSSPYLASLKPIRNWQELGLDPTARYFNSGVMVLNMARWRAEGIEQKLLSCLRENKKHVWCWDQYALNVVFAGEWGELPLRWNQGAHVFEFPSLDHSPFSKDQFLEMRENPAIIHFTTEWKPWHYRPFHPLRHLFFEHLDKTAWKGWRPEKPEFSIGDRWTDMAVGFTKRFTISYRKLALRWNSPPEMTPLMSDHKAIANARSELRPSTEVDKNLVTIFAIPKAFSGQTGLIQRNAIKSWKKLGPQVNVVLVGDDASVGETASELGVHHLPSIRRNKFGTPLVGSAFDSVSQYSKSPILIYCNADVILMPDFLAAIKNVMNSHGSSPFLAIGRRMDLKVEKEIDFENKNDLRGLLQDLKDNGKPAAIVCKEFFAFSRDLYSEVPDFAVGRGNWDNWMVASVRTRGVPVVDIAPVATVIHQTHDYGHLEGDRLGCYVTGEEARENQKLAGGRNLVRGSSSTWVLKHDGLRRRKFAWANLKFWSDSVPFVRLMLNLMTTRQ